LLLITSILLCFPVVYQQFILCALNRENKIFVWISFS